jgi:hypothetical protein
MNSVSIVVDAQFAGEAAIAQAAGCSFPAEGYGLRICPGLTKFRSSIWIEPSKPPRYLGGTQRCSIEGSSSWLATLSSGR